MFFTLYFVATPQTNTQTHKPTATNTWPGRMRARALNPPPPLGGRNMPNRNRELTDSKASAASAHSAGPVPKYHLFYFRASIFRFFQIFGPFFSVAKNL